MPRFSDTLYRQLGKSELKTPMMIPPFQHEQVVEEVGHLRRELAIKNALIEALTGILKAKGGNVLVFTRDSNEFEKSFLLKELITSNETPKDNTVDTIKPLSKR